MNPGILDRHNVKVIGQGTQPMMFAHGFGCDQNMWRFVSPAFEEDYKIVLFDYIGSSQSDVSAYNPQRYSTLDGYAEDILEICRELDLNDVILVAHSVSGMIALLAAVREPRRFAHLVFVSPSPRYINDAPDYVGGFERKDIQELLDTMDKNYIGWANFLAPTIMRNPDQPELTEELTESFCSTDPRIARQFAEVTFFSDNREDLPKLRVPSLIMQVTDDLIAPVEVGAYMHRQIPQSTLEHMDISGHCPHMSHPDETIRVIKKYLQRPS